MQELIYSFLNDKKMIKIHEDNEVAYITFESDKNEVVLKGNALGLIQLADYIVSIALKDFNGAHIHLDGNNFFDISDKDLIVSKFSEVLKE